MDILTLLRTILRRWLVVVPIVVLTAAVAFSAGSSITPEYSMAGTVLLTSGSAGAPAAGESVAVVTAPVLAEILRSAAGVKRMTDTGATVPYVVEVDPTTSILRVTAAGRDGPPNIRTVEVVLDNLDEELRLLEQTAEVPDGNRAAVKVLSRPSGQPGAGLPSASGSAFLVPAGIGRSNQYAANGYTTRILTELMLATESRLRVLDRAGGVAIFSMTAEQRDAAPILAVKVQGVDPRVTESAYRAVVATAGELLDDRQAEAGIEVRARTQLVPLNNPAGATKTTGTVVKSVATVVGLGVIAAATAAILVESLVSGRADRRRERPGGRRRRKKAESVRSIETRHAAALGDVSIGEAFEPERQRSESGPSDRPRSAPSGRQRTTDPSPPTVEDRSEKTPACQLAEDQAAPAEPGVAPLATPSSDGQTDEFGPGQPSEHPIDPQDKPLVVSGSEDVNPPNGRPNRRVKRSGGEGQPNRNGDEAHHEPLAVIVPNHAGRDDFIEAVLGRTQSKTEPVVELKIEADENGSPHTNDATGASGRGEFGANVNGKRPRRKAGAARGRKRAAVNTSAPSVEPEA